MAYPYRLPRKYRRYGRSDGRGLAIAAAVLAFLLAASGVKTAHHDASPVQQAAGDTAAMQAIAFARQQLGKPYVYGATGPGAYDCSGLVQAAWASAGVSIPRTSEEQWAQLPHVSASQLQPGDLLLYVGSPIDPPPGHVTLYVGGGQMIEAYGAGYPVRQVPVRAGVVGIVQPGGQS